MPLTGIDHPAMVKMREDIKIRSENGAGEEWDKGKEKEYCDQDGLLRSRRVGEHDDCTNVFFLVGIPS